MCRKEFGTLGIAGEPPPKAARAARAAAPAPAPAPPPAPADPAEGQIFSKIGPNPVVICPMTELPTAIEACKTAGLTPLIMDRSLDHSYDTFHSYSGAVLLDAKAMAMGVSMQGKTVAEVMEDARKKVRMREETTPLIHRKRTSPCHSDCTSHARRWCMP
jgi:hypothetical protein